MKVNKVNVVYGFISVLLLVIVIVLGVRFSNYTQEQESELAKASLKKAMLECYAAEGFYPTTVDYLKENYFLDIDEDRYYISYMSIGSNIMPIISVTKKR